MKILIRSIPFAVLLLLHPSAWSAKCGTALLMEHANQGRGMLPKIGGMTKIAATGGWARTLRSEHFNVNYQLRGIHRVKLLPEDASLANSVDSIYASFSTVGVSMRDSTFYARMDESNLPHPLYVRKVSQYMEQAWNYYVTQLNMSAPKGNIVSRFYNIGKEGKVGLFPVDVVDIGESDWLFRGETYGVTYPPPGLVISFENDFLFNVTLDPAGVVKGDSVKSRYMKEVVNNYVLEWEKGIKVTAFHEFYHAIQFTSVPQAGIYSDYHSWYEASAVGMEERLAPEVNDYLQYVPCAVKIHADASLLDKFGPGCSHPPEYGQGIFHIYLSHKLDERFDVLIWKELGKNGDNIQNAFTKAIASYGKNVEDVYNDYAKSMLFSGWVDGTRKKPEPFSADLPLWPQLNFDSLSLADAKVNQENHLPPLSFEIIKVTGTPSEIQKSISTSHESLKISLIHTRGDSLRTDALPSRTMLLAAPDMDFEEYYLVLANTSFTLPSSFTISNFSSPVVKEIYAYPNPVVLKQGQTQLHFAKYDGPDSLVPVIIFNERGEVVHTLQFSSQDLFWNWDMRDNKNSPIGPGIYYYQRTGDLSKLLLVQEGK